MNEYNAPDEHHPPTPPPGCGCAGASVPPHHPRRTDVDPRAAKRAERQVALLFALSALSTIAFIAGYTTIDKDRAAVVIPFGTVNLATFTLGLTLGLALFFVGAGAIHWARTLMTDKETIEERHPLRSSETDRHAAIEALTQSLEDSGIARRPLIRRMLIGALGLLPLSALVLLRDLGPVSTAKLRRTAWADEQLIVNENTGKPIRPADLTVGSLVFARPAGVEDLTELTKAAVLLVRLHPEDIKDQQEADWGYRGIVCFSKICTHVGCPVGLYEQQTNHALCPCHQSTFDLANGARVLFGPAARPLPQLPITVNKDGYLVARGDFAEPVGPSFFERAKASADTVVPASTSRHGR